MKTVRLLSFCQRYACPSLSPVQPVPYVHVLSFFLSLIYTYMRTRISRMSTHFFSFILPSLFFSFMTERFENTVDTAMSRAHVAPSYTAADSTPRRKYQIIGTRKCVQVGGGHRLWSVTSFAC